MTKVHGKNFNPTCLWGQKMAMLVWIFLWCTLFPKVYLQGLFPSRSPHDITATFQNPPGMNIILPEASEK